MSRFHYQAVDASGQLVEGELEANDVQEAVARLAENELSVQSIGLASAWVPDQTRESIHWRDRDAQRRTATTHAPKSESVEQAVLRAHMVTILERGQSMAPALRAYAEEMPSGRHRRQLRAVCRVLTSGDVSEATKTLSDFPEFWIPLLSAAATSTDPGQVLHEFLSESSRMDELRHQWGMTLIYPVLLLCLATTILVALSVFVIPEFRAIFDDFDLQLPAITSLVLGMASFLSGWGGAIIAILLIVILVLLLNANRFFRPSVFAWLGDRFRTPFSRRTSIARFAGFMADLLEVGVNMPDALRIAGFTVNRSQLQQAAWNLANRLDSNRDELDREYQGPLTSSVWHALTANVPTATRIHLLRAVGTCHAERVRVGLSWTSGIIEPLAICLVGISVGVIVLALFMPLVMLVEGLSG